MQKLYALAVAGFLVFGLAGSASAAPVAVTYGFNAGTVQVGAQAPVNFSAGQIVLVYATGSSVTGATLGVGPVSMAFFGGVLTTTVSLTTVNPVTPPTFTQFGATGLGVVGTNFNVGSMFLGGPIALGTLASGNLSLAVFGGPVGFASFQGSGTIAGLIPFSFQFLGGEISRSAVPEPGTAPLLLTGLAGLVSMVVATRRRS